MDFFYLLSLPCLKYCCVLRLTRKIINIIDAIWCVQYKMNNIHPWFVVKGMDFLANVFEYDIIPSPMFYCQYKFQLKLINFDI